VLDISEPVVVALGVFRLLDVWNVPDLFAVDQIGTEFQFLGVSSATFR